MRKFCVDEVLYYHWMLKTNTVLDEQDKKNFLQTVIELNPNLSVEECKEFAEEILTKNQS